MLMSDFSCKFVGRNMKKLLIILFLCIVSLSSCNRKSTRNEANSIVRIQEILKAFYYPRVPHVSVSPNESILDFYEKMCSVQTGSFQDFYLICDSCDYTLPIDVFSIRSNSDIKDILPGAEIIIKTDSTFTWRSNYIKAEKGTYSLVELGSVVGFLQEEYIDFSDILFIIIGDENSTMEEIVNIASHVQNLYWKMIYQMEFDHGILTQSGSSKELNISLDRLMMTVVLFHEEIYYECDCRDNILKQYEFGDSGFFMYF